VTVVVVVILLETIITILLTVTIAGAIPIALLLHSGQSAESYKTTLGFLKLIYPKRFRNVDVSLLCINLNIRIKTYRLLSLY